MSALGPAIGFLMGAGFLSIYVDPAYKPAGLDDRSPGWVGAWWIGFVLCGFLALIAGIPLMMFPKELPGVPRENKCDRKSVVLSSPSKPTKAGFHDNLQGTAQYESINLMNI